MNTEANPFYGIGYQTQKPVVNDLLLRSDISSLYRLAGFIEVQSSSF